MAFFTGTAGDDDLTGTNGDDEFDLSQGGNDIAKGRGGNDLFSFGTTFTPQDRVEGGKGFDGIALSGNSSIVFGANDFSGIDIFYLDEAFTHSLTFNDANVAAGKRMIIEAGGFDGANFLTVDGSAEADGGRFDIGGSSNSDIIVTGNGNDVISDGGGEDDIRTGAGNDEIVSGAGDDTIRPGSGNDFIEAGEGLDVIIFNGDGAFSANDHIDGGDLQAIVRLSGDYSAGVTFKVGTFVNLQSLVLIGGNDYAFNAGNMHPYDFFFFNVVAEDLGAADSLHFDGSSIGDGSFFLAGGAGEDILIAGAGQDTIIGNGGIDALTGGGGPDTFYYQAVSDSTGKNFDTVNGFDAEDDFFFATFDGGVTEAVLGLDPRVNGGTLSNASFNADLADAIGAGEMSESFAVLFRPDDGSFAGTLFLLIDGNDTAGYQANADIVIRLLTSKNMGAFDIDNFGTPG